MKKTGSIKSLVCVFYGRSQLLTLMHHSLRIVIFLFFFLNIPLHANATEEKKVHINLDQMTFEESITKISEIFDIEITLLHTTYLPRHKFSLTIEQSTFEEAIKEALGKAGLQRYLFAWDENRTTARIWILRGGMAGDISDLEMGDDLKTMTPEEYAKLEPASSENMRMMTEEEYSRLEPEFNEDCKGMTPEEFNNLGKGL